MRYINDDGRRDNVEDDGQGEENDEDKSTYNEIVR